MKQIIITKTNEDGQVDLAFSFPNNFNGSTEADEKYYYLIKTYLGHLTASQALGEDLHELPDGGTIQIQLSEND